MTNYVLEPGKACGRSKKTCVVFTASVTRHGAVRRAFRDWADYFSCSSAEDGNAQITTAGIYGTNKTRPINVECCSISVKLRILRYLLYSCLSSPKII